MVEKFKFDLGVRAKDAVSGFEGVIVGRSDWLTGCNTYGLQAPAKDGDRPDLQWFDETRLEVTVPNGVLLPGDAEKMQKPAKNPGGPQPTPQQTNHI